MINKPVISIVVRTYNRAQLLVKCLQSLIDQSVDKSLYEIIVVNNNSTDNTQQIINQFTQKNINLREIKEKKRGFSYTCNTGWKNAKGKYVAYIDDDSYAEPNYIEEILVFLKKYPKINFFGGPYKKFSLKPLPSWFPEENCSLDLGNQIKKINCKNEYLSGTNIIFNKKIFLIYGGFKNIVETNGHGEDTEMVIRLNKKGESIYYVPNILVNHLVAAHKQNLWWLLKSNYRGSFIMSILKKPKFNFLRGAVSFILALLFIPVYLIDIRKGMIKRRLYYGLSSIFLSLGQMVGSIYNLRIKLFNK